MKRTTRALLLVLWLAPLYDSPAIVDPSEEPSITGDCWPAEDTP